jgi:proteasome lid subunit RPN8/RPN11
LQPHWQPTTEACGVIDDDLVIIPCQNHASDPYDHFKFSEDDLKGVATWHTHPQSNANLSIADYWFFVQWSMQIHFIVAQDEVRCYAVHEGKVYSVDQEEDFSAWLSARSSFRGD